MKVGDYVRTECGISKIENFETKNKEVINLDKDIMLCNMDIYRNCCTISQIIKSSPNIIDLIEVGDVITIEEIDGDLVKYEVEEFQQRDIYGEKTHQIVLGVLYRERYKSLPEIEPIIKSIVTKEQFESMEYEVK